MSETLAQNLDPETKWTEEEEKVFRLAFDMFDANGDGLIDLNELDTGFASLGQSHRQSILVRMIETVDANQDMQLDFEEFKDLMKLRRLDEEFRQEIEAGGQEKTLDDKDLDGMSDKNLESLIMGRFGKMLMNEDIRRGSMYGKLAPQDRKADEIVRDLEAMDEELKKISDDKKETYLEAKKKCPELMGDKFMIMFLRADSFNAKGAAIRYTQYWKKRLEIFGPDRAFLPLTQSGALQDDAEILSKGILKNTGKKDSNNQVLLFLDLEKHDQDKHEKNVMLREFWYSYHAALEDEDAQKNGIVILVRAPKQLSKWDPAVMKGYVDSIRFSLPTRLASGHVINPPTLIRVMFRIIDLFAGNLRAVRKTHTGTPEQIVKQLEGYGITKDVVPKELGGDLVIKHEEWLKQRRECGL